MAVRSRLVLTVALATLTIATPAQATFPGRNGEILFTQAHTSMGGGDAKLIAIHPRTGAVRRLWECSTSPADPAPECDDVTTPAVSPDGRTAAIISLRERYVDPTPDWTLTFLDVSGGAAHSLALPAGTDYITDDRGRNLRWLGDGSALTASVWENRYSTLAARHLGLDGTLGAQVGVPEATSFDWSADGRAAFIYRANLFVLGADGRLRRLTQRGAGNPSWSPDGRRIAFDRGRQIWIVGSHGGRPRRVTVHGGRKPGWSPDGRRIAFVRRSKLHILDVRGGPARKVSEEHVGTFGYGSQAYIVSPPEWRPLPR